MADSEIEWTEKVWNPVRGCALVSPGCAHCYAMGMGPITLDGRWRALLEVRKIQREINDEAARSNREPVDLLSAEESARIVELIAAHTWPNGWDGDEPAATKLMAQVVANGSEQPLLYGLEDSDG